MLCHNFQVLALTSTHLLQAEKLPDTRKRRMQARIRTAITFMNRRMEDELEKQLMLDEEFGMPSQTTGKECVHRVEGLKAGESFQFQVRCIIFHVNCVVYMRCLKMRILLLLIHVSGASVQPCRCLSLERTIDCHSD